jgi:hypothetical protein
MELLGFEEMIMAALGKDFRRKVEAAIAAETWEKRGTRRYCDCTDMAMGCCMASGGELVPVAGGEHAAAASPTGRRFAFVDTFAFRGTSALTTVKRPTLPFCQPISFHRTDGRIIYVKPN